MNLIGIYHEHGQEIKIFFNILPFFCEVSMTTFFDKFYCFQDG